MRILVSVPAAEAVLAAVFFMTGGCGLQDGSLLGLAKPAATSGGTAAPGRETSSVADAALRVPGGDAKGRTESASPEFGQPSDLPRPSTMSTGEFEAILFPFLKARRYRELGWKRDKTVRDTGPFLKGVYYGTHPAVRVYYSPGIIRWLSGGRQGAIADGEMIIKEQYAPPAALHEDKDEQQLRDSLESWTVMVKDSQGSHDGWFWSNPGADAEVVNYHTRNEQPYSGFGLYCIRCHASTQSPGSDAPDAVSNEFTFAALRNIEGFAGQPILFRVDDSWRSTVEKQKPAPKNDADETSETASPDAAFLSLYDMSAPQDPARMTSLPPSSHDAVPARRGANGFSTSDQCMSCHAGLTGPLGPVGFVHTGSATDYGAAGINVSPYGQWRWTPMGLAGRDPIFLAQLESEVAMIRDEFGQNAHSDELAKAIVDACLRCHGAMGHQQFHDAHTEGAKFSLDDLFAVEGKEDGANALTASEQAAHGALARDGISCMVCHRLQPRPQPEADQRPYLQYFLETSTTGNLYFGPPGEVYGPYKDHELAPYAMHHATGMKPRHSDYIQKSQLCGSCHTVSLPTIDRPLQAGSMSPDDIALTSSESVPEFKPYRHHLEQATYLEWLNSQFNDEVDPANPRGRSCQSCHMAAETFADEVGDAKGPIRSRIAAIQDSTYPDAENLADHSLLQVRIRDQYRRHDFAGLNVGLLELFKQFNDVLGVKRTDYMTGSDQGAEQAIASMVRMARRETATVSVTAKRVAPGDAAEPDLLEATVQVTNLAGHRFPSGVGFRRAFLELKVVEARADGEHVLWSSGRTNSLGVIVGSGGQPLATEFFSATADAQPFQPHHRLITSPEQVQIYETLLKDNGGRLTTSFVRGCETVKDNRLLPQGWSVNGPGGGLSGAYLEATYPGPLASDDEDFIDGSGSDSTLYRVPLPLGADPRRVSVQATLYYQATPPYYLNNLFRAAPDGEATQRLHSLTSRLQLHGTAIEDWKLKLATASAPLVAESAELSIAEPRPAPVIQSSGLTHE